MDDPIEETIRRQIEANQSKNLLYEHFGGIIEVEPGFLAALEKYLGSDEQVHQELVSFAAEILLKRLFAINQFLRVEPQKVKELENIYSSTWREIQRTRDIEFTLRKVHYPALSRWIANLYPEKFVEQLKAVPQIGHVVCAEYSPKLQIDLLKLDLTTLKQPILDVGCGSKANLVHHLRSLGWEVYGIDRALSQPEKYLQPVDWLDYSFTPNTWGTIISNMAFSNHLLYTYHHDSTQLEPYMRKYNEILESLLPGGSFHYAPGIPFIEQALDSAKYQVERRQVVGDIFVTKIVKLHRQENLSTKRTKSTKFKS